MNHVLRAALVAPRCRAPRARSARPRDDGFEIIHVARALGLCARDACECARDRATARRRASRVAHGARARVERHRGADVRVTRARHRIDRVLRLPRVRVVRLRAVGVGVAHLSER